MTSWLIWAGVTVLLSSCSTVPPSPNKRSGLLERIAQLDRNSPRARRVPAVARLDGGGEGGEGEEQASPSWRAASCAGP